MAKEQVFKFPGFFEREIDLTQRVQTPRGTPAGIIGTSEKGPAFVPVIVGSFPDFRTRFGDLDAKRFGPYAVNEFLKHKAAVTYLRVLGAGANDTVSDIERTRIQGTVRSAGFVVDGVAPTLGAAGGRETGGVVFIAAKHSLRGGEALGFPVFTDNNSFNANQVHLIRAMVMLASGTRMIVANGAATTAAGFQNGDDEATLGSAGEMNGKFKLIISSSAPAYGLADGFTGIRVLTASLNPSSNDYVAKVLNTNPDKFNVEEHLLYTDFAVEDELAYVSLDAGSIALLSGSAGASSTSGDPTETYSDLFGRFDIRFTTPSTTMFISQPFGKKEFNLFRFESISDGKWANSRIKVSIANVRKSVDPSSEFGTFAVQIRDFDDNDLNPKILEQFPNCSLDPASEGYIGRVIGDLKASFMFDADDEEERRIVVQGKFPNRSQFVRVVIDDAVEGKLLPASSLPFGFRGVPTLKTTDSLNDYSSNGGRLVGFAAGGALAQPSLASSVVPPLPFTFKVTKGVASTTQGFEGQPGSTEIVDSRIYWGVKTTRIAPSSSLDNAVLNANASSVTNPLVRAYTKFVGIQKLDAVVTGSGADTLNDNKFSLAKVALSNATISDVTGTASQHMREAVYVRDQSPDVNDGSIVDVISSAKRMTLGSLVNLQSSVEFNRFSGFTKFTNIMYGGFDGVNILDSNASRLNDKAASSDTGGNAENAYVSPGLSTNVNGVGKLNNAVFSYRSAAEIMTDEMTVNTNILSIPGIRDSFITDHAATRCKLNGLIFYVQDVVEYDENLNRLFDEDTVKPDVRQTVEQFESRTIDNNYAAAYFPDVIIDDISNSRRVKVPASVAIMGVLAYNDRVGFPWWAPAGFNRAALDFVRNVDVRLNQPDRERVYEARINPITHFPKQGTAASFVVFGQKTLQASKSALDRVNVRRLLLEVKRIVATITREGFVFEANTPNTRERWVSQIVPRLGVIQVQQGIEAFRVVMDETNNTVDDVENNKLRGRITIVPTRTIEHVAIDFIITPTGVDFVE